MKFIDSASFKKLVSYKEFLPLLKNAFRDNSYQVPKRMHLDVGSNNISLVMPCWNNHYYGIKQVLVAPKNKDKGLPTIRGKYDLYNAEDGSPLLSIDAKALTNFRTAATSLLATSFFKKEIHNVLIMGAGAVASSLLEAYQEIYSPMIYIWNRNRVNAELLNEKFNGNCSVIDDHQTVISKVEVISCASHSELPILFGENVTKEQHIDLIGSYTPNLREADDQLIIKGQIYIDDWPACEESGDLAIPLARGIIDRSSIKATLFELCREEVIAPKNGITIFKSVGNAIEDLAAAIYIYKKF